jgi:MATE family multidrug resistance protein
VFNFLGISTQTEVARALGRHDTERAGQIVSLALLVGMACGVLVILLVTAFAEEITTFMGAEPSVQAPAVTYIRVRMFGAPAVIGTFILLAALRGLQAMRAQLIVAVGINVINIALDGPLIFGLGPIPALDVAGAALASTLAQWIGMTWALWMVARRLPLQVHLHGPDVAALFSVGRDLFVRTGMLMLFLIYTTRVANQIGAEAGAAHQSVRTVWLFFSLLFDGFAITAQSLVGYFHGADRDDLGLSAANIAARWSLGVGAMTTVLMLVGTPLFEQVMLPPEARAIYAGAWLIAAITQPIVALAFVTDGIHWGTGDYAYLRNAMIAATVAGALGLALISPGHADAFTLVWVATGVWVTVRAAIGVVRIWPGIGASPLRVASAHHIP